jgi:hypothetical protein
MAILFPLTLFIAFLSYAFFINGLIILHTKAIAPSLGNLETIYLSDNTAIWLLIVYMIISFGIFIYLVGLHRDRSLEEFKKMPLEITNTTMIPVIISFISASLLFIIVIIKPHSIIMFALASILVALDFHYKNSSSRLLLIVLIIAIFSSPLQEGFLVGLLRVFLLIVFADRIAYIFDWRKRVRLK